MLFYKHDFILLVVLVLEVFTIVQGRPVNKRSNSKPKGEGKNDSNSFSGFGTFFDPSRQGGANGACGGPRESASSDIVALNSAQYGPMNKKSEWCGKKVLIKHAGKKAIATIEDACPGCEEKSLDMTPSVFNKLASSNEGVIPITWCIVGDEDCN